MSAFLVHLSAGVQVASDMLLAAWTIANASWTGRLAVRRRQLARREEGKR